jgi:hypothetical protein
VRGRSGRRTGRGVEGSVVVEEEEEEGRGEGASRVRRL